MRAIIYAKKAHRILSRGCRMCVCFIFIPCVLMMMWALGIERPATEDIIQNIYANIMEDE